MMSKIGFLSTITYNGTFYHISLLRFTCMHFIRNGMILSTTTWYRMNHVIRGQVHVPYPNRNLVISSTHVWSNMISGTVKINLITERFENESFYRFYYLRSIFSNFLSLIFWSLYIAFKAKFVVSLTALCALI